MADKAKQSSGHREFTHRYLSIDLQREYRVVFRRETWELECIIPLQSAYQDLELTGSDLPDWLKLDLGQTSLPLKLKKLTLYRCQLYLVCEYPKGGKEALRKRSWLNVHIQVPEEKQPRRVQCKLKQWRTE